MEVLPALRRGVGVMRWRPDDWEENKPDVCANLIGPDIYEMGADAMLEAIALVLFVDSRYSPSAYRRFRCGLMDAVENCNDHP